MNAAVVLAYLLVLAGFIFILLFGQSAQFEGTLVQKAHYVVTEGLCAGCSQCAVKIGGKRAQRVLDCFGEYYCDRPNPTLQVRMRHHGSSALSEHYTRRSVPLGGGLAEPLNVQVSRPFAHAPADLLPQPRDFGLSHFYQLLL